MHLRHLLHHHFPGIDPVRLPGGFDLVGDIAVVGITAQAEPVQRQIASLLLAAHPQIRVVAKRAGAIQGSYRTLPLEILGGEPRLHTVHRENGVTLHLDLGQVYFSVRSAGERARIAALVSPDERVAVLGAGVGPFPLIIAKHSAVQFILGIEQNPVAHSYALQNLKVNRRIHTVELQQGDAAAILPTISKPFDRILIVLPYGGEALLPCALASLRAGGTLHMYDMQAKGCSTATLDKLKKVCSRHNREISRQTVVRCGHCGPVTHRVCVDAQIAPLRNS